MAAEHEVIEQPPSQAIYRPDNGVRAEVDMQVATAKAYPRSIRRVMNEAKSMATASQEIAEGCIYSYRRGGENVSGPSIRLAEIMQTTWGNLRCQKRIGEEGDTFVIGVGTVWDMERNVLAQVECRRSIINKHGQRFSADMITMTGNAAASIALRNAMFQVIPKAFVDEVYVEARKAAVGDLKSIADRRSRAFASFAAMGVATPRVLARLGITDEREITLEHLEILTGIKTSLKEGDVTLESEFPEPNDAPPAKAPPAADKASAIAAKVRGAKPTPTPGSIGVVQPDGTRTEIPADDGPPIG